MMSDSNMNEKQATENKENEQGENQKYTIELKNVTKRFGNDVAVDKLNLQMEKGTITMLIGPSGCGKTTTMKMINRLVQLDEGEIKLEGTSVYDIDPVQLRRTIGYVIQEIGLFPHFTVYDNIATVPRLLKWDESKIKKRVEELLDMVTLDSSYAYRYPLQLSGGERQRVGLARALGADPEVLLMDEPFGAIDPINRLKLHDSFLEIQDEIKKTIVFVTHDINEAIKLGDKVAIIRDGKLVQYANSTEILYNPANKFVENLLGQDRSLKALTLKRTKDFISSEDTITVDKEISEEEVLKLLQEKDQIVAFVLDENGKLSGRYWLEKTRKDKVEINYDESPILTEQNNTLNESLSTMFSSGEKLLPVVNRRNKFMGVIRLNHIFEEFNK
ncbi:MAG: ATP-binding cassette domain-containing protein [Atribacterota bacterium]|jgi:osmoprotectant transport system ATP-binding protein|nr:ATP-binding cassette domain-containing protein [Atribacterota bacterium]MDD4288818.1 ATP-binding cassette domain-containing protein [Atribacterota bacterium]MDI9597734.1 ATP-binding cassette domain-containing protein [Atribacterota bacterium]